MPILGIILGVACVLLFVIAIQIPRLIHTCGPNEVLVFSGRTHHGKGYRVVKGGWAIRVPLIEKVDRIDLTNMNIEVTASGAFAKGESSCAIPRLTIRRCSRAPPRSRAPDAPTTSRFAPGFQCCLRLRWNSAGAATCACRLIRFPHSGRLREASMRPAVRTGWARSRALCRVN